MMHDRDFNLLKLVKTIESKYTTATAIVYRDTKSPTVSASYNEILQFSNRVTEVLQKYSIPKDAFIGLKLHPGISFVPLIIGILKFGAAFVCINPEDNIDGWNNHLLRELGVCWLFVAARDNSENPAEGTVLEFHGDSINLIKNASIDENKMLTACSMTVKNKFAFACQTSGSTGKPKIIKIPHASIVPNITYLRSKFGVGPNDVVLQVAPPTFDPSVVEIFMTMASGATLLMIPHAVKSSPVLLAHILSSEPRPTIIQATPSFISSLGLKRIQTLLLANNSMLRVLALGGEPCPDLSTLTKWKSAGNKTLIFNLYGVTEVSCWSTCHQVHFLDNPDELKDSQIPLGEPLPYTQLQVRDQNGHPITCGEGELFISNGDNMCQILSEAEDSYHYERWCATGDLVKISSDANLYFLSRRADTRVIKRWGHKVSLAQLEVAANNCELVQASVALSSVTDTLQLVLFVVTTSISDDENDIQQVKKYLRTCLPSTYLPDAVISLLDLPLTRHGKLDKRVLKIKAKEWERGTIKNNYHSSCEDLQVLETFVTRAWQDALGQQSTASQVDAKSSFLANGGDSASAALLAAELLRWAGQTEGPGLLTAILETTFKDVCYHLKELVRNSKTPEVAAKKARKNEEESGAHSLQTGLEKSVMSKQTISMSADKVVSVDIELGQSHVWQEAVQKPDQPRLVQAFSKGNTTTKPMQNYLRDKSSKLTLDLQWRKALGKCVDASPLIMQYDNDLNLTVIGSHSGRVLCLNIETGTEIWKLELGERIESSAVTTLCGQFIYIGSYDGRLYCIEVHTGHCCWAFQTGAMIKGSALVFKSTVLVGSYDQKIYSLNSKNGSKLWQQDLEAGAILASPCLSEECVLVATLGGLRGALCVNTGVILWSSLDSRPYFASPALVGGKNVLFAAVNGLVSCVNVTDGIMKWSFQANSNIFSSFAIEEIYNSDHHIYFGTSDGCVYCLNINGKQLWTTQLSGRITSSPFIFCGEVIRKELKNLIAICNAPSQLTILNCSSGHIYNKTELPQETFSSPVVIKNCVIVGCRDDYVYCYKLSEMRAD